MSVLPQKPNVYPASRLEDDGSAEIQSGEWWTSHIKPRVEKLVARRLFRKNVPFFLPLFERSSRSKSRVNTAYLPLFSQYVSMRGDAQIRTLANETNLVKRCLNLSVGRGFQADLARVQAQLNTDFQSGGSFGSRSAY